MFQHHYAGRLEGLAMLKLSRSKGSAMKLKSLRELRLLVAVTVVAGCRYPGLEAAGGGGPRTPSDSIAHTAQVLSAIVGFVDTFGRQAGGLPTSLTPVLQDRPQNAHDAWGLPFHYAAARRRFEVRSAGPDAQLGTPDDLLAVGVLGRIVPCELRTGERVVTYDDIAPPCDFNPDARVLPKCPELLEYRPAEAPSGDSRDSVLVAGRRLVRFARAVDGAARELGGLPPTLRSVPSHPRVQSGWDLADIWGKAVRYTPRGTAFEVRSAGSDGSFDTLDDVVVTGELGRAVACEFMTEHGIAHCESLPPVCPAV